MTALISKGDVGIVTRLLSRDQRGELFQLLLEHNKGDLKETASQMAIHHRAIYRYLGEKRNTPNPETASRILLLLLKGIRTNAETKEKLSLILVKLEADTVASLFAISAIQYENAIGQPASIPLEIPYSIVGFLDPLLRILLVDLSTDQWLSVHPEEKRKRIMKFQEEIRVKMNQIIGKYRPL